MLNCTVKTLAKAGSLSCPLPAPGQASPGHREQGCPPHTQRGRLEGRESQWWNQGFLDPLNLLLRLGGPATPWPKPSGQSNQPGQVWAWMFGTAVTPPGPQPAYLPATSAPPHSMAQHSVAPLQNGLSITWRVALALLLAGSGHLHPQQK